MWKVKELENYFLDAKYLAKSDYLSVSIDRLSQKILERMLKFQVFWLYLF